MKNTGIFFCLLVSVLFISPKAYTQKMNSIDILNNLNVYKDLLKELYQQEISYLQKKENFVKLIKAVSQEYSFIKLELIMVSKEKGRIDTAERLYFRATLEIKNKAIVFTEVYCADELRKAGMEKMIDNHKAAHIYKWEEQTNGPSSYKEDILQYLIIADAIAKRAQYCASGDDYRPGYFSKIMITDEGIILSQINYMNSRSIDHKQDYSLRKLEFTIPLINNKRNTRYDYQIGEMLIEFSDSSSPSNRSCGESIIEQIEKERFAYDKK